MYPVRESDARPSWPVVDYRGRPIATAPDNIRALLDRLGVKIWRDADRPSDVLLTTPRAKAAPLDEVRMAWLWGRAQDAGLAVRWSDFRRVMGILRGEVREFRRWPSC
jgi:hypothetical protein